MARRSGEARPSAATSIRARTRSLRPSLESVTSTPSGPSARNVTRVRRRTSTSPRRSRMSRSGQHQGVVLDAETAVARARRAAAPSARRSSPRTRRWARCPHRGPRGIRRPVSSSSADRMEQLAGQHLVPVLARVGEKGLQSELGHGRGGGAPRGATTGDEYVHFNQGNDPSPALLLDLLIECGRAPAHLPWCFLWVSRDRTRRLLPSRFAGGVSHLRAQHPGPPSAAGPGGHRCLPPVSDRRHARGRGPGTGVRAGRAVSFTRTPGETRARVGRAGRRVCAPLGRRAPALRTLGRGAAGTGNARLSSRPCAGCRTGPTRTSRPAWAR